MSSVLAFFAGTVLATSRWFIRVVFTYIYQNLRAATYMHDYCVHIIILLYIVVLIHRERDDVLQLYDDASG